MSRTHVVPAGSPHPDLATHDAMGLAKDTEVTAAVAALVNSAPATLDTLAELATAIGSDAGFATTMTTALAGKASAAIFTQLASNVDGLSFNSQSLADITGLLVALAVSSTYIVRGQIIYEATTAADYGIGCTVPTGATFALHVIGVQTNVSAPNNLRGGKPITATGGSQGVGGNGAGVQNVADVFGWIKTDATHAGNLQMKHSQFTLAEATDIKAYAGSWLMAQKVA